MRWIVALLRRAPVTRRELGQEVGDVGRRRPRPSVPAGEEGAELQQVRPVGLERVARHAALELQIGEEVEHQLYEAVAPDGRVRHPPWFLARSRPSLTRNGLADQPGGLARTAERLQLAPDVAGGAAAHEREALQQTAQRPRGSP